MKSKPIERISPYPKFFELFFLWFAIVFALVLALILFIFLFLEHRVASIVFPLLFLTLIFYFLFWKTYWLTWSYVHRRNFYKVAKTTTAMIKKKRREEDQYDYTYFSCEIEFDAELSKKDMRKIRLKVTVSETLYRSLKKTASISYSSQHPFIAALEGEVGYVTSVVPPRP